MGHIFIKELQTDDVGVGIYYCKDKQIKTSKVGKDYISLILSDSSGGIDTKIWDIQGCRDSFLRGDYVKVEYRVSDYLGKKQMTVSRIRKAAEDEYDISNYIKTSSKSLDELKIDLDFFLGKITNEYSKELVNFIIKDKEYQDKFYSHTAAKSIHHNYFSGLLEHTISLLRLCDFFATNYGADINIMFPACIYHDIGKIYEITQLPDSEYTIEGSLIGHIMIGYEILSNNIDKIENFPKALAMNIKHCVLAHHGRLEYGSPKLPSTLEALAVHLADFTDSRLASFKSEIEDIRDDEIKSNYSKLFEAYLYKTII